MTQEEAEEYTLARWIEVDIDLLYGVTIGGCIIFAGEIVSKHLPDVLAAAEFTLQREEEIRQKRFDIDHVTKFRNATGLYCHEHPYTDQTFTVEIPNLQSWNRILAILESQLAALLVGWKETP